MKYMKFNEVDSSDRKTKIFIVNTRYDDRIGVIRWFSSWRKYCFYPDPSTLWDTGCLSEVIEFIDKLMEERKKMADWRLKWQE